MWKTKVVDLATNIVTVSTVGVNVWGVYVNTGMSAHACNINNGATSVFSIPASTAAGTVISFAGDEGVLFDTSLIVDPDDAGTGNFTIMYKDQR